MSTVTRVGVPVAVVWTGRDAWRPVDQPALDDAPDIAAWTIALDTPLRLDLLDRTVTNALLGERVIVVAESNGWSEIRLPEQPSSLAADGYPGWVRSAHLVESAKRTDDDVAIVTTRLAAARLEDGSPIELSIGTALPVLDRDRKTVRLRHPDGRVISMAAGDLSTGLADGTSALGVTALGAVRDFAGLPYLWGGLSGYGVDCSGLAHLAYRSTGTLIPRDAHDQAVAGTDASPASASPGDLVFFARGGESIHHVGVATTPGWMLHAPRTGDLVGDAAIDSPSYAGEAVTARSFGANG
jgi:hypothetical protein